MLTHADYLHLQGIEGVACAQSLPLMALPIYGDLAAVVVRVIDGDSVKLAVLLDAGTMRISGIDAPEMNTAAGKRSKQFAEAILPVGRVLLARIEAKREKFGRLLGNLQMPDGDWLAETMVANNYARDNYHGGKRG